MEKNRGAAVDRCQEVWVYTEDDYTKTHSYIELVPNKIDFDRSKHLLAIQDEKFYVLASKELVSDPGAMHEKLEHFLDITPHRSEADDGWFHHEKTDYQGLYDLDSVYLDQDIEPSLIDLSEGCEHPVNAEIHRKTSVLRDFSGFTEEQLGHIAEYQQDTETHIDDWTISDLNEALSRAHTKEDKERVGQ